MTTRSAKACRRPVLCGGRPVSLVVLAGGRSRRMGRSKALLPVACGTLLEHVLGQVEGCFDDILISLSPGQRLKLRPPVSGARVPKLRIVRDAVAGQGPMAGVLAGLSAARHDVCAVVACDIPDVPLSLLRSMARLAAQGDDAVVPVTAGGLMEPLFAVYRRTAALKMKELLAAGRRSLLPLLDGVKTRRLLLKAGNPLRNLNTPGEYRAYLESVSLRSRSRNSDRREKMRNI